jgi:hypothetical protein
MPSAELTARLWLDQVPVPYRHDIGEELILRVDALPEPHRPVVLASLDRAVATGVCDPFTLTTIVDVVCASLSD